MGGFNSSWFISFGFGVLLVAAELLLPDNRKKRLGKLLLVPGVGFVLVGFVGLAYDGYLKWHSTQIGTGVQPIPDLREGETTPAVSNRKTKAAVPTKDTRKHAETESQTRVGVGSNVHAGGPSQNNCPNGICISGGTVSNPQVNNYGPPDPFVLTDKQVDDMKSILSSNGGTMQLVCIQEACKSAKGILRALQLSKNWMILDYTELSGTSNDEEIPNNIHLVRGASQDYMTLKNALDTVGLKYIIDPPGSYCPSFMSKPEFICLVVGKAK